jgi:DNA-binding response OmpR family regulator
MPTLLLVADASWVVNEVRSALAVGNWQIEVSSDPEEAAGRAVEIGADAVVVDMQVKAMGGMAVVRDIRQSIEPEDRPRTILLLDRAADEFLARRAGADQHVIKPINAHQLRTALSGLYRGDEPGSVSAAAATPKAKTRPRRTPPSSSQ